MPRKLKNDITEGIPDFEIQALARAILPAIQEMYKDEAFQEEFEEWQKSQLNRKSHKQKSQ